MEWKCPFHLFFNGVYWAISHLHNKYLTSNICINARMKLLEHSYYIKEQGGKIIITPLFLY